MQSADNLVLNLCSNIKVLLQECDALRQNNDILIQQVDSLRSQLEDKEIELEIKIEEISKKDTGQVADNADLDMETKSKIDELIVMIDDCINTLSK